MSEPAIKISANSRYLPERSSPDEGHYVFAYTIVIENLGDEAAQLLDRHWIITDADGNAQEVRGQGVVGEQPRLEPGERYEYTSGTVLPTPLGSMHGSYGMIDAAGTRFEATIPAFSLASITTLH
ncbi:MULTISPECIES: Co2+/Mg2+ efflux protein ApaG [Marichromatium]|uniref:Protein ApaG n=1 Tax=Marichromatium gracile TaxID=1048 RepID=A0ABR5VMV6_MARGR|nr:MULTISPECIES: Co2+/Mg2+ efflux protein ApaG [Marichromatium]KXX65568.1 Co2+/Mg2+ efflux protein ApaG [Marichromatium gracile]MBO8087024.1 Co2+/Mg2+ efflux protein ApaG [Marichromatium sp.]RNE88668.1 Co2+/Mg2+ efflux protein ApaG [Marichromatium sp. AB31]